MLTSKELDAIVKNPANTGKWFFDEKNLRFKIKQTKNGHSAYFYFRYREPGTGKYKDISCGSYPKSSLSSIRKKRDEHRLTLSNSKTDPAQAAATAKADDRIKKKALIEESRRLENENLTIRELFNEWTTNGIHRTDGNKVVINGWKNHVLPTLARIKLNSVNENHILEVIRQLINDGKNRTATMRLDEMNQMFSWAEKRQPWRQLLIENGNPCALIDINGLLPNDYEEERDRILSDVEIIELSTKLEAVKEETQCALWLCLSTLCRIGELLQAEWCHVDLKNKHWLIPASNVKGRQGKKQDLHVFLSDFATRQFQQLKARTGHSRYCFPATNTDTESHVCLKSVSKQVSDRQHSLHKRKQLKKRKNDDSLVLSHGINGNWTPHDLRRTGATLMQKMGISLDVIDRCQNHVLPGGRVRRHYLHHDYKAEKTQAWQRLGEHLECLLRDKKPPTNTEN